MNHPADPPLPDHCGPTDVDRAGTDTGGARDGGLATVWAAAVVAVLMVLLVGGLHLGAAILARHRAESAADLAALAGAQHSAEGERVACGSATAVADADGSSMVRCRQVGWDVLVDVQVPVPVPILGAETATARARAGPAAEPVDDADVPPGPAVAVSTSTDPPVARSIRRTQQ